MIEKVSFRPNETFYFIGHGWRRPYWTATRFTACKISTKWQFSLRILGKKLI